MAEDDEDGEEEEEAGDHEAPAEQREAGGLRLLLSVAVSRRGLEVGEKPPASALPPAPPLLSSPPALTNSFITSGLALLRHCTALHYCDIDPHTKYSCLNLPY